MKPHQLPTDSVHIAETLSRIAYTSDFAENVDDYLDLLTDDVEFAFPDNPAVGLAAVSYSGRDAVKEGVESRRSQGLQGPGTSTLHVISNVFADLTSAETATATAYWRYFVPGAEAPELRSMGVYKNEMRKVDGKWLLARRAITVL